MGGSSRTAEGDCASVVGTGYGELQRSNWCGAMELLNMLEPIKGLRGLKGVKGLCEQQCSADCPGIFLGNGKCNDLHFIYATVAANRFPIYLKKPKPNSGCNTAACEYDKGDCPR